LYLLQKIKISPTYSQSLLQFFKMVRRESGANAKPPRVQSVARAVQMVDLVARSDHGLSAKEISVETGVNRSATYHLLHTLTQTDVLARDGRRYVMGPRAGVFSTGFSRHRAPNHHVIASARKLAGTIRQPVIVAAWGAPGVTVLGRTGGVSLASELRRGFAEDSHARASGKLLLALEPREARDRYLQSHALTARTGNTITDRALFERELDEIRERGYAVDEGEFLPEVCCISGALETGRGHVALSAVVSARRFRAERELYLNELTRIAASGSGVPSLV
jgi:IclR family acetate operon transcriptional repressor